nr:hypothetical protein [Tanacetum cinerariifolium]
MGGARGRAYAIDGGIWYSVLEMKGVVAAVRGVMVAVMMAPAVDGDGGGEWRRVMESSIVDRVDRVQGDGDDDDGDVGGCSGVAAKVIWCGGGSVGVKWRRLWWGGVAGGGGD